MKKHWAAHTQTHKNRGEKKVFRNSRLDRASWPQKALDLAIQQRVFLFFFSHVPYGLNFSQHVHGKQEGKRRRQQQQKKKRAPQMGWDLKKKRGTKVSRFLRPPYHQHYRTNSRRRTMTKPQRFAFRRDGIFIFFFSVATHIFARMTMREEKGQNKRKMQPILQHFVEKWNSLWIFHSHLFQPNVRLEKNLFCFWKNRKREEWAEINEK